MGKSKRIKIPKNRSISEMLGEEDSIRTMKDAMDIIDKKRKQFLGEIKHSNKNMSSMDKKLQNVYKRKDAQLADMFEKDTYKKYPKIMIAHRAFTLGARDIASDVLFGIMETKELKVVMGVDIEDNDYVDIQDI